MKAISIVLVLQLAFFSSCNSAATSSEETEKIKTAQVEEGMELATVAGGCFWCIEAPFEGLDGITSVISGYSGGTKENPTYGEVSSGATDHLEAVQITFDPEIISYSEILDIFWRQFDPTDAGGSFYDRGKQYTSAIFYHSREQKAVAENSIKRLEKSGIFDEPIVTKLVKFKAFYKAEEYHQDYYKKKPEDYKNYRKGSGRDAYIEKVWGTVKSNKYQKPEKDELAKKLNDMQYQVTQKDGTEPAFDNPYWDNKKAGIYVDIVSGEPLYSSKDKFKSGSGWPSFTRPIDARYLKKVTDRSFGMLRVEVRSTIGDSHLGHVFYDGPEPTKLRYCMNSASMLFIPKEEMKEKGYGEFLWAVE